MRKIGSRWKGYLAMALTAGMLAATSAVADISIKEVPDFVEDVTIGGGTELYFMAIQQNAMGIDGNDYNWVDGHFKLNAAVKLKSNVDFKLGMLYAGTFGEDYFSTFGIDNTDTSTFNADEAYIKFNKVFNAPVDLTFGRQKINVEKGFLMSEGNLDFSTAIYANSEKASPFAIRADVDLKPITLLAYWETIETDPVNVAFGKGDDIEASGLNVNAALAEGKNIYAGAVRWLGTLSVADFKQELMTYYVGTDLTFGPVNFSGEYAMQTGDNIDTSTGGRVDQDASAYNAFLKYSLDGVSMKPWFEVGTIYYSGDDASTADNEGFNTMTPGFPDWGKWCPGEIFGEQVYFGANNWVDYTAQIGIMPTETTQIRLQYHMVSLAEDNGGDDALYDEYNLFLEYFPDANLYCGIMLGMATPDDAHKAAFGDETAFGVMPYLIWNF